MMRTFKIRAHERGLLFRDRDFQSILQPGRHWFADPLLKIHVTRVSVRDPWLTHRDLDVIVRSGALGDEALVLDLHDHQRALVWIDDRLDCVLGPGQHVMWTVFRKVEVEILDARERHVQRGDLPHLLKQAKEQLDSVRVESGHVGLLFVDGRFRKALEPGLHAFWKGEGQVRVVHMDQRESVTDIAGQDIMTADKVTLRLNAVLTWKVTDALKAMTSVEDYRQALYRDAQLSLRSAIGTRTLDELLADKDAVALELRESLVKAAATFGVEVSALGIRDVILPGDMKELMNRVIEARKASEAALITRREETAAMRSQANTARLLDTHPTLMRLHELEVLERVSEKANLRIVLGEGGLTERVTKLI